MFTALLLYAEVVNFYNLFWMMGEVHTSSQKTVEEISFFFFIADFLPCLPDPSELDVDADVLINLTNTEVTCFRLAYQV